MIVVLVLLARREERVPPPIPEHPTETLVAPADAAREQVEAFLAAAAIPAGQSPANRLTVPVIIRCVTDSRPRRRLSVCVSICAVNARL